MTDTTGAVSPKSTSQRSHWQYELFHQHPLLIELKTVEVISEAVNTNTSSSKPTGVEVGPVKGKRTRVLQCRLKQGFDFGDKTRRLTI
jgi:hypothetical protein